MKSSNQRMEEEMRQIKSVNINLRNDVSYSLIKLARMKIHKVKTSLCR